MNTKQFGLFGPLRVNIFNGALFDPFHLQVQNKAFPILVFEFGEFISLV